MTVRSRSNGPNLNILTTGGARVTVAGGRRRRWHGMPSSSEMKGRGDELVIPLGAGDRGVIGGEGGGVEVLFSSLNRSPELTPAAVRVGRGRSRGSGAWKNMRRCQEVAQERNN